MPNKDESPQLIDIREDDLLALSTEVLDTLLRDHTTGKKIFWATHDYEALGSEGSTSPFRTSLLPLTSTGIKASQRLTSSYSTSMAWMNKSGTSFGLR